MELQYNKNPKTYPPEIDEDAGEVICDVCKGNGYLLSKLQPDAVESVCWKCQGDGKVDWLSHIMGKAPPEKYTFNIKSSAFVESNSHSKDYNDIVDAMAYALANTIDKEIMDTILNDSNKHIKNHYQEGNNIDN